MARESGHHFTHLGLILRLQYKVSGGGGGAESRQWENPEQLWADVTSSLDRTLCVLTVRVGILK